MHFRDNLSLKIRDKRGQSTPLTFRGRNAILMPLIIGVLCPGTERKDKMTMKSKTERINCDNAKAASAAPVRVLSHRSCHGRAACPHAAARSDFL